MRQLTEQIVELKPAPIIVESTSGYERPVLYRMLGAQLPMAMHNPRPVRDFELSRFTGLGASDPTPDETMVLMSRRQLREAGHVATLFDQSLHTEVD